MNETEFNGRFDLLDRLPPNPKESSFADAVVEGLCGKRKHLPCRFFYDAAGSKLFDQICDLPEYYLTRAETEILDLHADEMIAGLPDDLTLVELGSGSATKTRLLIEALLKDRGRLTFTPIDISKSALESSSVDLLVDHPGLEINAVAAEYQDGIKVLRDQNTGPELILWLGSSIGNLTRPEAVDFLRRVGTSMSSADRLLVGVDLRKSADVLEPAYDDAAKVTAAFNLNILKRINAELGGRFDVEAFSHQAVYDEIEGRVEMYLVSEQDQVVRIEDLDVEVSFRAGERIHTENSYKYSLDEIDSLVEQANLVHENRWFDSQRRFSLNLIRGA